MIEDFLKTWPIIVLIASGVGFLIAWLATRDSRKRTGAAQKQTIEVYQQTLEAKDTLALTLATANAKQVALWTEERKECDTRNEKTISEYRSNLHIVRNELQECTAKKGELMAELADLRARTDFKPVMEFLQNENRKSTEVQEHILKVLSVIAPVLERVMQSLQIPQDTARKVEVVNTPEHPVPTVTKP